MASIAGRLGAIKAAKGYASGTPIDYPELLAALFEDAQIDDANSGSFPLEKRLGTILAASTDNAYPWLTHFSGILYQWTDEGFRTAFKDPWLKKQQPMQPFPDSRSFWV